ncbi:MAG: hypothetical protein ACK5OS_02555 [Chryseotalea sp.]|jgi:hypothetical protein
MNQEKIPILYNFEPITRRNQFLGVAFALYDANGAPINLAGATIKMDVREKPGATAVISFSTAANTVIIETDGEQPVQNQLRLAPRTEVDMNIPGGWPLPKKYKYDIEISLAGQGVQTFFKGDFPILEDITQ